MNTTYYVQNVNNITEALWIQSVNCDNQQFQRYQQKEQSATISSHLKLLNTKKGSPHIRWKSMS
jgi:hypothetical protein